MTEVSRFSETRSAQWLSSVTVPAWSSTRMQVESSSVPVMFASVASSPVHERPRLEAAFLMKSDEVPEAPVA